MNTQEFVNKLVGYINEGKNLQAEEELYADDVVSVEQNGYIAKGKEAVMAKTKTAVEAVEQFFGGGVSQTYVGVDSFILEFDMDVKRKGEERGNFRELGFYKLKDGKVSEEYFFIKP
jgi:hypothetical protein